MLVTQTVYGYCCVIACTVLILCDVGYTALHAAAEEGHTAVVRVLLGAGANVRALTTEEESPLFLAASAGHLEIVKALVEANSDLNQQILNGSTALLIAMAEGHKAVADYLLQQNGVSVLPVDEHLQSCLHFAVLQNYGDIVQLLLSKFRMDVNQRSLTGLTSLYDPPATLYIFYGLHVALQSICSLWLTRSSCLRLGICLC